MSETNKIEVEKKESEIVEGYNHLTEEDFSSESIVPEEAKEEAKEAEVKADEVDVESTETEPETPDDIPEDSSDGESYEINGTTYTKDEFGTRMIRDYKNLVSHTGRQAEKIGEYKSQISELETNLESTKSPENGEAEEVDYNDYDIYTPQGIAKLAEDMAEKKLKAQTEERESAKATDDWDKHLANARSKFLENHPSLSDDDMLDLVNYGQSQGLVLGQVTNEDQIHNYLESVYSQKTGDYGHFTNKKEAGGQTTKVNQVVEKVKEGQKVKAGLGNVHSSEEDGIDYDGLNETEWEKLPVEKRNELLGITD